MYYKGLNKNELVELCKTRGLSFEGNKNILVARLLEAEKTESKMPEIFPQGENLEEKLSKTSATFTNENFYLHIKLSNLSNYFTFGYIYPLALEESEIYKSENRAKDILSTFEDYIIVGKAPINNFEISDVLIELVLNDIQVNELESTPLFYVAEPIPVSRIKLILFKSASAKATFISSVKTFPDSFIPNSICEIIAVENEKPIKIELDKVKLPRNENLNGWKSKLELFDKILGLFAFIKNANVFYAERESRFENYSAGFFGTLNLVNPIKQLSTYKENVYLKPLLHYRNLEINSAQRVIFKSVIERVYANKSFDFKTAIEILENSIANEHSKNGELTDIKEQIELFKQLDKLAISFKDALQKEVFRKTQNLPVLALLFLSKFPNKSRQHTDKQAVRNAFIQNEFAAPLNIAEYILGFLGLYYGYKNMIKEDTNLKFNDNTFEQLATNSQSIKFKLESYFERFIIESTFQFAVRQKVLDDTFDFLNWNNKTPESKPTSILSTFRFEYLDKSFYLFGQKILNVIRQDKSDKVFDRITSQYSDKIENTSYLAAFFSKYFRLDKWQIIDLLKKNKSSYPLNELEDVIDMDNKNKKK